jgi:hypothetical protein
MPQRAITSPRSPSWPLRTYSPVIREDPRQGRQVDYVDLTSGFYEIDKRLIYPSLASIVTQRREETVAVAKRHEHREFIYSGRSLRAIEAVLPANLHIGLCRDLIANPDYLRDRHNGCINSMKCHYYSRGETHPTCGPLRASRLRIRF